MICNVFSYVSLVITLIYALIYFTLYIIVDRENYLGYTDIDVVAVLFVCFFVSTSAICQKYYNPMSHSAYTCD